MKYIWGFLELLIYIDGAVLLGHVMKMAYLTCLSRA